MGAKTHAFAGGQCQVHHPQEDSKHHGVQPWKPSRATGVTQVISCRTQAAHYQIDWKMLGNAPGSPEHCLGVPSLNNKNSIYFACLGSISDEFLELSQLYTQELFLVVLRGLYGMLRIEPRSAACKASALSLSPKVSNISFLFCFACF